MDNRSLLRCPFCGSKAKHATSRDGEVFAIRCSMWGEGCMGASSWKDTQDQAANAWNSRAAAPQPPSASDERERFEAWAATLHVCLLRSRIDSDKYRLGATQNIWAAWQARAALAPSPGVDAAEQKPYAYEYGRSNGDGTYSVVIDRGSLVRLGPNAYGYGPPTDAHKDRAVRPLYAAPSPAASADEWLKEAEELVNKYQIATRNAEAYDSQAYDDEMAAARAALLAHLKKRHAAP